MRVLLRNRRAYLPAVAILALGLGMSVAMFSLVDAVLLRPLPFPDQDRIHVIWKTDPQAGVQVGELAYPELADLQHGVPEFEAVALLPTSLYGYGRVLQNGGREPVQIESTPVSHDFFRVLGVAPRLGRDFNAADERVGSAPVVVLSDRVWQTEFAADPAIVGRSIRLNQQDVTVIGVMAAGVEFPRGAGLWIPLGVDARIVDRRGATFLQAIARARSSFVNSRIAADVNALFHRVAREHPEAEYGDQSAVVTPLVEYWTGSARAHLWIMLGASLLLLVAAVVSAGNLILSRTLSRSQEFAVRMALGARGREILTQLAGEGALISLLAAVVGLAVAQTAVRLLVRWAPSDIPRLLNASVDLRSFCFASTVAALAAIACVAIPGRTATQLQLETALREGGARLSLSRRGNRTRGFFVLTQAAVTVVLLGMAALLVLSYRGMISADTGFSHRDALTMNLQWRGISDPQARRAVYAKLLHELRQAPGVTAAAAVLLRPLEGGIGWDVSYDLAGGQSAQAGRVLPKANYEVVTPGYFSAVGTTLLEGRDFNDHDTADSEPVVIVSRSLAARIRAAGFAPLGHRIRLGLGPAEGEKIVGIAADARYRNIAQTGADIFVPAPQATAPTNYLAIRGSASARELSALVRHTLAEIDPAQAIAGVATIGELIDRNAARHRFNMVLLLWFGVCAAVLAATGVYSVLAEAVVVRRHEIAIRIALGAPALRLVRDIVSGTLAFVVAGELLGIVVFRILGRAGAELFYGVTASDPVVPGVVAGLLFLLSLAAAAKPARAAALRNWTGQK